MNFGSICTICYVVIGTWNLFDYWSTTHRVLEMWNLKHLDLIVQELCMTAFTILVSY